MTSVVDRSTSETRRRGRAITRRGPDNASTTELRAASFAINRRRKRLHPKLAHAETMRARRLARRRPRPRALWMPLDPPRRQLPLTTRANRRLLLRIWAVKAVHVWPTPPAGLL